MENCNNCGQSIPVWLKENQLIAKGCKIIGITRNKGEYTFVYYEPITNDSETSRNRFD